MSPDDGARLAVVPDPLDLAERSVSWWIGDRWAFGEARYGERKAGELLREMEKAKGARGVGTQCGSDREPHSHPRRDGRDKEAVRGLAETCRGPAR